MSHPPPPISELDDSPAVDRLHSPLKITRLYQDELLEQAKRRNIIIRADTGIGKTLVAIELIKSIAAHPPSPPRHLIQAFLVPTRPLVFQQARSIQSLTHLNVKAYTGEIQPELWNMDRWQSELTQTDLIVCTAQIFYDIISKGYWRLQDVSLLVFDEAHHCRKSHVYNQIMKCHYHRIAQDPTQPLPKILGLTASPIWDYRDLASAEKDVLALQSSLAAQVYEIKQNVDDLLRFNSKPQETTVYFEDSSDLPEFFDPPWDNINPLLDRHASPKFLDTLRFISLVLFQLVLSTPSPLCPYLGSNRLTSFARPILYQARDYDAV